MEKSIPPHPSQLPGLAKLDPSALEANRLQQHAISGLTDALRVLSSSPITTSDLQQALGRGMRGVTAIKRLKALHHVAPVKFLCSDSAIQQPGEHCACQAASPFDLSLKQRRRRRYFDRNYKQQVVQFILQHDLSVSRASEEFGITSSVLRRWIHEFDAEPGSISGAGKPPLPESERICALEERLRQLQSDNELLKKTTALFVRDSLNAAGV